ncbi:proteasome adapter and scaffold protein ECM29-like isoform X2 [Anneissia japonica]|uniref:proteasome adapter and scaffold protein ECM29-like isoform X2 n=1 Tax=Anneissia japonica TaxID=1529436 RepID=UPI00142571F2|nr:proteasome adapter and scaffold protein ECM29-like isoform X2 [Anneissia japonica]
MSAQEELALLDRVFLRVGSATTDEELEKFVNRFLPPVLLKLASKHEGVRKKVIQLLAHVNKRLKSRPQIQLPMEALLNQYKDPASSSFVTNFTIMYMKDGYSRLPDKKKGPLVGSLIQCLEDKPTHQQHLLLQMIVSALPYIELPKDVKKKESLFGLSGKHDIANLLLDFMLDYLLLPYTFSVVTPENATVGLGAPRPATATAGDATNTLKLNIPPGLSANALKKVIGDRIPEAQDIELRKVGIVKFISAEILPEKDVACHLIVASADTRYKVVTGADIAIKRFQGEVNWNDAAVVDKLYTLFLGNKATAKVANMVADNVRQPVATRIKLKLFPYLLKSREATNHTQNLLKVVSECVSGESSHDKLTMMGLQFVHHVSTHSSEANLKAMGSILMPMMVEATQTKKNSKQKGLAYTAVAKLSKRLPELVTNDISIVQSFFDALCKEDPEMRMHIQEALSMMTDAFKDMPEANLLTMEAIILSNAEKVEPQARLAAAQYAAQVFPSNHIPSRYVLLLNTADSKEDIRQMSLKAVHVGVKQDLSIQTEIPKGTHLMPKFQEMAHYIYQKAKLRIKGTSRVTIGTMVIPFTPAVFNEIIFYLRSCLVYETGVTPVMDALEMQDQAPGLYPHVQELLSSPGGETVMNYVDLILQLLNVSAEPQAMYCLVEIVAIANTLLADMFFKKLDWIKNFMKSGREVIRDLAAQLMSVVGNAADQSQLSVILTDLLNLAKSKSLEIQHGAILGLGYTIGRRYLLDRKAKEDVMVEDMEVDESTTTHGIAAVIKEAVEYIAKCLGSDQELLCIAACTAIGEIGRNGTLPFPRTQRNQPEEKSVKHEDANMKDGIKKAKMNEEKQTDEDMKVDEEVNDGMNLFSIVKKLSSKLYSIKIPHKLKERACKNLGYIPIGDPDFPYTEEVLRLLMKTADTKQIELQFTVGEAVSQAALAFHCPARRDVWSQAEPVLDLTEDEAAKDRVEWTLLKILKEYVTSENPHKKQAACIWLLSMVKQCGSHPALKCRFKELQQAFMDLLSENNEFTQDVASKGLSLVYEQSSEESRQELVTALVDRLMTGKRAKQTVTDDTKLFDEGALGKNPTGGGLTTYKELCSLASDLNQPDLVYKFMHLASHNAMWNSRKGAAFGFGTIAKQASEQLAAHLPNIVPRLYRYQYDPNRQIQQAMTSIWSALVTDEKKVIDQYLLEILKDVQVNLTNSQWRNRESSCRALVDLLRNRELDSLVSELPELWETCLRVADDIKATVREAAEASCRQLSKVSIKLCDVDRGKLGTQAIAAVLPCLLKGLSSAIDKAKKICLDTIVKIAKNAGKMLTPHIPLLVVALLESLSGLEDDRLNYLSLRVSGNEGVVEKLDDIRVAAAKSSSMMETVALCTQYVDKEVLKELVPRLIDVIKYGVGVNTKAGAANFMVMLSNHCPRDLEEYASKILSSLLAGFSDRSAAVRKSNASAIGHLVEVAKDSSVEKLINRLKSWYLEKDDDVLRDACGLTLHAISRHNADILKNHASAALPLTFLAMHEKSEKGRGNSDQVESIWEEIWLDSTPGTEGGIRLFLPELVAITQDALASQSWPRKAQGARAINTIASKLGSTLTQPHLGRLLQLVVKGLAGRTWDGKEELLKALTSLCTKSKNVTMSEEDTSTEQLTMQEILLALLKECKKEKISYKVEALQCISTILLAHDIDRFAELADILYPVIDKTKKKDGDEEEEEEEDREAQEEQLVLEENAYECLGKAWPKARQTQDAHHERFCGFMCAGVEISTFKIQVSILKAMSQFLDRLVYLQADLSSEDRAILNSILEKIIPVLCSRLGIIKYVAIRRSAVKIIDNLVSRLSSANETDVLGTDLRGQLLDALNKMGADPDRALRDQAADARKAISSLPALPVVDDVDMATDKETEEVEDVDMSQMKDQEGLNE